VGKYLVSICTNIACLLNGGMELLEHAEKSLGVRAGSTTADGQFTIEEVECIADCGRAPCLAVNWRFFGNVSDDAFDTLVSSLRAGERAEEVPAHGTLNRVRRDLTAWAGGVAAAQSARAKLNERWAAEAEGPAPAPAQAADGPASASAPAPAGAPTPGEKDQRGERQPESAAATESAPAEAADLEKGGEGQ
jgi:hypothetical protein